MLYEQGVSCDYASILKSGSRIVTYFIDNARDMCDRFKRAKIILLRLKPFLTFSASKGTLIEWKFLIFGVQNVKEPSVFQIQYVFKVRLVIIRLEEFLVPPKSYLNKD